MASRPNVTGCNQENDVEQMSIRVYTFEEMISKHKQWLTGARDGAQTLLFIVIWASWVPRESLAGAEKNPEAPIV